MLIQVSTPGNHDARGAGCDEPARVLAKRHGTTEQTVAKWRKRDGVEDRSHTFKPH